MNTKVQNEEKDTGRGDVHGKNTVSVYVNSKEKDVHRGSYELADLKAALGVDPSHDLDVVDGGVFRQVTGRTTIKEGMEFVSRQPSGGSA